MVNIKNKVVNLILLILIILSVGVYNSINFSPKDLYAVERVIDGDTIVVKDMAGKEDIVRLLLIDSPEYDQYLGSEATLFAKKHLEIGDIINLEIGKNQRDKYDRLLAYVWIDDVNFNKLMLEAGYARLAYIYKPNTRYLRQFKKAEALAIKSKLNIWSVKDYVTKKGFDMSVIN